MDDYPQDYVVNNKPLYVLSGIDVEEDVPHKLQVNGPRVGTHEVQVQGVRARQLVDAFSKPRAASDDQGNAGYTRSNVRFCRAVCATVYIRRSRRG